MNNDSIESNEILSKHLHYINIVSAPMFSLFYYDKRGILEQATNSVESIIFNSEEELNRYFEEIEHDKFIFIYDIKNEYNRIMVRMTIKNRYNSDNHLIRRSDTDGLTKCITKGEGLIKKRNDKIDELINY